MTINLAIDFGTCNTLIARTGTAGAAPQVFHLGRSGSQIPSTAYMDASGNLYFGEDADDMAQLDPANYRRAFKLQLGSPVPLLGKYTAQQLLTAFLKYLLNQVKQDATMHGAEIGKVLLTHPVNFTPVQKEALKQAALAAGLADAQLLPEPAAAGRAFCHSCGNNAFRKNALMVDWGGGTLDVVLVSRTPNGGVEVHPRHTYGNNALGGEVFDDRLSEHVLSQTDLQNPAWPELRKRVRELKHHLSSHSEAMFSMQSGGRMTTLKVTRADFEARIRPDVEEVSAAIKELIAGIPANLRPEMLVLVGGTALVPAIRPALEAATGLPARTWTEAHIAVVKGAALGMSAPVPVPRDTLPKEFNKLRALADAGNADACCELGKLYAQGSSDLLKNEFKACEYYEKAVQAKHPAAMYELAFCYERGWGGAHEPSEVLNLYRESATLGCAAAQCRLAQCCKNASLGAQESLPEAIRWYELSAQQGYPMAQYELGLIYVAGENVQANPARGYGFIRGAADAGYADAQCYVGEMYEQGKGLTQDMALAELWYKQAANQQHPEAMYRLASRFEHEDLLKKAAQAGNPHAIMERRKRSRMWFLWIPLWIVGTLGLLFTSISLALIFCLCFPLIWLLRLKNKLRPIPVTLVSGVALFLPLCCVFSASDAFKLTLKNAGRLGDAITVGLLADARDLHDAAKNGETELVRLMLAVPRIGVNKTSYDDNDALYSAVENGHTEVVRLLLAVPGIEVNTIRSALTPLYSAAKNGHTEVVRLLLADPGIEVNKTSYGVTPLDVAKTDEIRNLLRNAGGKKGSELW